MAGGGTWSYYGERGIVYFYGVSNGNLIPPYGQRQYDAPRNSTIGVGLTAISPCNMLS